MSDEIPDTATDAELDARMIRELRSQIHPDDRVVLMREELDALLRAVDERDRLRREFVDMPDERPAPVSVQEVSLRGLPRIDEPSNITPLHPRRPADEYVVRICDDEHPARPGLRCARRHDHVGTHAHNGTTWPRRVRSACTLCGHNAHVGRVCFALMGETSGPTPTCRCGA